MAAERKFRSEVFRCEKVAALDGIKLFKRCSAMLGPEGLASVRDGLRSKQAMEEFLVLATSPSVDGDELTRLMGDLASLCTVKGDPCVVGVHVQDMEHIVEVAFWVMEVQFKDFLAVALVSNDPGEKNEAA